MRFVDKRAWGGIGGRMLRGTTLEGQERSGRREHARGRIRPGGRAEQAVHAPEDSTAAAPGGTAACF